MNKDQLNLLVIEVSIAGFPAEDQQQVEEAAGKIRELLATYAQGHGQIALALVGAEIAASAK